MRAYLQQLDGSSPDALGSLREAETVLQQEHPTDFSRRVLLIYGNYAWIYYHLSNYEMVELYLGRIREICQFLSSPEPYSVQMPEIHAQKGWSLLSLGFQNGEEAQKCFQVALQGDKSSQEFQAGLAISAFASWTRCFDFRLRTEVQSLMEPLLCRQPQNDELKVHLASLLEHKDWRRSEALAKEVAENSHHPEHLRFAARLLKKNNISRAVGILREAIGLAPGYHLLHYELGVCYKQQLEGAAGEVREEVLAAAIESFKRAVEADPQSIFFRLELAQLYCERNPTYAEEMYRNLLEELPKASQRCQQAIYLHWGDFLLRGKGLRLEALEAYKAGCAVLGGHKKEWQQLTGRLGKLAEVFEKDSEMESAEAAFEVLRLRPQFQKEIEPGY
ncbi:interferon-induced protein with tetratricopeptide repeats 1-like [Sphaerodactylus townsendi]|uniref:interferon-induced protein with tetratricopeptide repeats 1-like n=1 Tax=Sphaerodactylus townsendi TaxID=933632 RepID=UPI002025D6B0|nr:interferon-induced protein with tetratricopeptide repeats 1-like [Sphaerodactylus townsendi]